MRVGLFAVAAVVAAMIAPGSAVAAGGQTPQTACIDFTCVKPGSKYYVPEARASGLPSVRSPEDLAEQTVAGFYEYGHGTTHGERAVAYVVPHGQAFLMPESVRDLPAVRALTSGVNHFERGTVVILGPDASRSVSDGSPVSRYSATDCPVHQFCLFDGLDFIGHSGSGMVQFGSTWVGEGWINLRTWDFSDRASSMINNRHNDSKLAEHINGDGTKYCAQAESVDSDLRNNAIGNNEASSFKNTGSRTAC